MKTREALKIYRPHSVSDGAGVNLLRAIGTPELNVLDPFLLLDEFRSDNPDDYIGGFPSHPHRGFETVTYMLEGIMHHEDSTGEFGDLTSGAVQWMTAGRGIIHSEMPQQVEGLLWGFQLWVNLPASEKMRAPRYQNIDPADVPVIEKDNGTLIKIIAGKVDGMEGAAKGIVTDPLYLDITVPSDISVTQLIPEGHNAFAYVIGGELQFGDFNVSPSHLVALGDGDEVTATAGNNGGRFLLLAGRPLDESIARHGPFVMNTKGEIKEAINDYNSGKFL